MSSNTNSNTKKKRRVGSDNDCASGEHGMDCTVHQELNDIKSTMNEMMEHTRLQTQNMTNMMHMMKCMQGEITSLRNKNDGMEKLMQKTLTKCDNLENMLLERFDSMDDNQNIISDDMNSRFDDVDKKQKYHEVLLRNQQWKYSAPRPPQEYWNTIDDDEADSVEQFLSQIKQRTEQMRYGTGDGVVIIRVNHPYTYNEAFLPHWKEFANALEQYQYHLKCLPKDSETKLYLHDMELPNEVLELLSKALESTYFNRLVLENNVFGQCGIDFALKYLKSNCILKKFFVYDNPFENMKDIKQLCQTVEEHPSIETLAFCGCCSEGVDGYEVLKMVMNAGKYKLKVIDLSNNNISTGGDTFVSEFLSSNHMLATLCLRYNQFDDNDAVMMANALNYNTHLRTLDLRGNSKMKRAGWEALRKAEFDGTSLNSAADSNHTCCIGYPSGDSEIRGLDTTEMNGNLAFDQTFNERSARQKKVYSVLSSRNRNCSNVGHFDDIPVELLPDMLSTIQQYSEYHSENSEMSQDTNDVNPLSLVFEVCRYWDKSIAVYELLSS